MGAAYAVFMQPADQMNEPLPAEAWKTQSGPFGAASFLVDSRGYVIRMTKRAGELIAAGDALTLGKDGVLRPRRREDAESFAAILSSEHGLMRLKRGQSFREYVLIVCRGSCNRLVLTAVEADTTPAQSLRAIGRLYRLTEAETALVIAVFDSGSRDLAAERLGISLNTAKTHLAAIFRKTGTNSQGEVIRLFSVIATAIAHVGDDN